MPAATVPNATSNKRPCSVVPPTFATWQQPILLFGAITAIFVVATIVVPPYDDEAYYWCWAKDLQLSYYDHAPMTAWMIAASTSIFGNSPLAMRLPAILCLLAACAVVYSLSRPRDLLPFIFLTPAFALPAVIITPDSPLMGFWALYVFCLVKIHQRLEENDGAFNRLWILGGVLLGCSILSKYTAGLAIPAGLVSFLFVRSYRRWIFGYALHIVVAFIVSLPILIFNIQEDFAPLLFQWHHAMDNEPLSMRPIGDFLGIQVLIAGVLPIATFFWAIRNWRTLVADPRLRVCACMFVVPFAFFIYKGARARLEGNWTIVSYIAAWPLVLAWYELHQNSLARKIGAISCLVLPVSCVLVLLVHSTYPISLVPAQGDRLTRQVERDAGVQKLAEELKILGTDLPVFAPSYQYVSLLRFRQVDAHLIHPDYRPSHFAKNALDFRELDRFYLFTEEPLTPAERGDRQARVIASFPITVRGLLMHNYQLIEYSR